MPDLLPLEARLGVRFSDRGLLQLALTHRSAASEPGSPNNERLEFLGDAVVGMSVVEYLHRMYPMHSVGAVAKIKALAVSEPALAAVAREIGIHESIHLSGGEQESGGAERASTLADAMEAVIGALFLDQGAQAAHDVVLRLLEPVITAAERGELVRDFKSALQERTQAETRDLPEYRTVEESGRDHEKQFVVSVSVGGREVGHGVGRSKKEAEQAAARDALSLLTGAASAERAV